MNIRRIFTRPIAIAVALVGCMLIQSAHAQPARSRMAIEPLPGQMPPRGGFMPGRFQHVLEPDYHLRDGALLHQELQLDRAQRPIIELLLEDYRTAFDEAAERLRDAAGRVRRPAGMFPGGFAAGGGGFARGEGGAVALPEGAVLHVMGPEVQVTATEGGGVIVVQGSARLSADGGGDAPPTITLERAEGADGLSLSISIEGVDVPDEVRERLDRAAREIAERMAQRVEALERRRQRAAERGEDEPEPLEPEEVISIAREFLAKKEMLRERFEQDVQSLLSPDQLDLWPDAKALIRRLNRLQLGRLSGESVDLTAVVRDLRLPSFLLDLLEPRLAQYVADLDAALEARTLALDRADIDLFEAMHKQDFDRMLSIDERVAARRVAVRDVNERHAQHMAAAIESEEWRERFIVEARLRTYPWISRPTPFTRLVNAARDHEEITDEHREFIDDLVARYEAEIAVANEKAIEQLRETEHMRFRHFIEMMQQMHRGEQMSPPMAGVASEFNSRQERMSVAMRYARELRNALPAEMLPEATPGPVMFFD